MEKKQSIDQFKGQTRLPNFAIPKRYELHLIPNLSACNFSGTIQISLTINENTNFLVLNSLELVIHITFFTNSYGQQYTPSDVIVDDNHEIPVLVFDETLSVGEGVLVIEFSGILSERLRGFYRCTYVDGEVKKNMAATQFEAVDARRCFPCWDEPALKATFKVTHTVPSEYTALSNMPVESEKLDGELKTIYFEETPIMSTYLVAFVVGLFDHIEDATIPGVIVRLYCAVGKSDQGKLAMDIAMKTLEIFAKYFSVPYPLPKLDLVAVPEFSGGAMENYGLIIYRENELLYHELHSTPAKKQRITIVTAHEIAHQWFGNLVTMEWWTHLWLNEGFATWISYMVTNILFPEWNIWTQFLLQTADGLQMDALEKSHPIEVEIQHARSVIEVFDAVSYNKGSAVIRMLQGYLGDVTFQVCYNVLKISFDAIPDLVNELKQYFVSLLMFSAVQLGWDSISEDHSISLLRGEVFQFLATFDHDETQQEALRRFQILLNDRSTSLLSANTIKAAYIAVMRNTTSESMTGLESLLTCYRSTDVLQERERILRCIASSADPNIVLEVLNLLLSDEFPDQDIIYVLAGISIEGSGTALRWLKDNWERIMAKYGAGLLLTNIISKIVPLVNSNEEADEIEAFFASRMNPSIVMNLNLSIEKIRNKAKWIQSVRQEHSLPDLIKQLAQRK